MLAKFQVALILYAESKNFKEMPDYIYGVSGDLQIPLNPLKHLRS